MYFICAGGRRSAAPGTYRPRCGWLLLPPHYAPPVRPGFYHTLRVCCPGFRGASFDGVARRALVGARVRRAPSRRHKCRLARATASGIYGAFIMSGAAVPARLFTVGIRRILVCFCFTRPRPVARTHPPWGGRSAYVVPRAQRGYYIVHPAGRVRGFGTLRPFRPIVPHARHPLVSSPQVDTAPPAPPRGGVPAQCASRWILARAVPPLFAANLFRPPPAKRKRSKKRKGGRPPEVGQPSPLTTYIIYGVPPCQHAPYVVYTRVVRTTRLL